MKARVIVEQGADGTYSAYISSENIPYGIIGEGNSVSETIEDFKTGYEEMKESYALEDKEFPECEFEYVYDVASFL
ncbi:hypothetical protein [uncultured Bacteroides sp.]|uniref:hypothetical protein n=1 Tax=uncultured Bacteroides sp. TaxID=162156 RepID=UPI002AAC062D|nr:hypothetical protein [uncultured Bacteroides sp.]